MAKRDIAQDTAYLAGTDIVVPLLTEELSVTRRDVVRGTVRVEVKTHSREQVIDELLAQESVEIERVSVGRTVKSMPEVRQEGDTTIIPIVEEVIVTERRLILKEEVRVRRVRTTDRHYETVVLRTQDAEIARIGPGVSGHSHPQTPTEELHR